MSDSELMLWAVAALVVVILLVTTLAVVEQESVEDDRNQTAGLEERDQYGSAENNTVRLAGWLSGFDDVHMLTVRTKPFCHYGGDAIQTWLFGENQEEYWFRFDFETQTESIGFCVYRDAPEYIETIGGGHRKKWEWAAASAELEVDDPFNGYALSGLDRRADLPVQIYTDKTGTIELTAVDVDLWYAGDSGE